VATDPAFAATVALGAALLGSAETDTLTPTTTSVIVTAGSSGSKIEQVTVNAAKTATLVATTVAGQVYLFLYDGTTYRLMDSILVTAVTASTTVAPFHAEKLFTNLVIPSGWSLRASQSISGNASLLQVMAFGGSF
jgi:hypothetical protein